MWKAFGLIVVRTKTRNFETFETRKHYCFTNMRHAKHISGIETIKTDCYKENTTLRFKKWVCHWKSETGWTDIEKGTNRLRRIKHKNIFFGLSFLRKPLDLKQTEKRSQQRMPEPCWDRQNWDKKNLAKQNWDKHYWDKQNIKVQSIFA